MIAALSAFTLHTSRESSGKDSVFFFLGVSSQKGPDESSCSWLRHHYRVPSSLDHRRMRTRNTPVSETAAFLSLGWGSERPTNANTLWHSACKIACSGDVYARFILYSTRMRMLPMEKLDA